MLEWKTLRPYSIIFKRGLFSIRFFIDKTGISLQICQENMKSVIFIDQMAVYYVYNLARVKPLPPQFSV